MQLKERKWHNEKSKAEKNSHLEYFGIEKVEDKSLVPEGMYLIEREKEGTWLMSLKHICHGDVVHIGTLDLHDVMCVANKSHLANVKKEEFYEALEKIFNIDFRDKLYASKDIATVFSRVGSYTKGTALTNYVIQEFERSEKQKSSFNE